MGLAASQARALQLNARKSDLEFQGQQINQQRTALANQVETFYNQILALAAPNSEKMPVTYAADGITPTNDSNGDGLSNEYQNSLADYSAAYNKINAQIEIIHEQDRQLEVNLKNVDTQHNTVQTEIDSVKKVIDKTIEMTYKTFQ